MIKTLTLNKQQLNQLQFELKDDLIDKEIPYSAFVAKVLETQIVGYNSGKVVFQGKDLELVFPKYQRMFEPFFEIMAGSDEVGTGDYFGPVVVCACFLDRTHYQIIRDLQIDDSKKITDSLILEIGPILYSRIPNSLLILDNKKYNEIHKTCNLNKIKALLHNKAYLNLNNKVKLTKNNIIDQFTPEANYYRYLKDEKVVFRNLIFHTKAESKFLAVACASIIARYTFLREFERMNDKYNFHFPKGAGSEVDKAIVLFNKLYPNKLGDVAKMHFKNTQVIL